MPYTVHTAQYSVSSKQVFQKQLWPFHLKICCYLNFNTLASLGRKREEFLLINKSSENEFLHRLLLNTDNCSHSSGNCMHMCNN